MSDSRLRLVAMLEKVRALVCSTSVDAGQNVFDELDLFARTASQEKARRSKRQTKYTLEELLCMVDENQADSTARSQKKLASSPDDDDWSLVTGSDLATDLETCSDCSSYRSLDHTCHRCSMVFCWRCAGYHKMPASDPVYPSTGDVVKFLWYCRHCLQQKSVDIAVCFSSSGRVCEFAGLLLPRSLFVAMDSLHL